MQKRICAAITIALSGICMDLLADNYDIHVPSDSKAKYSVLEKTGYENERTIVTKRIGSSGTSYSRRLYDCSNSTVKYLGTGNSIEDMNSSRPDEVMVPVIDGSIAYYVGIEACK